MSTLPPLKSARVLVTGGAGFLGGHLCAALAAAGAEVHATSRSVREASPDLHWWRVPILSPGGVARLLREIEPQIVFHLAGQVSAAADQDLVLPTFESLLASTVNVLNGAAAAGVGRVILTGSLTEPQQAGEAPSSPYAAAKWASTMYARMFHQLYDAPVVIVRPFMAYGPGQHPSKIIPHVIDSLLAGHLPALSSGTWPADWVYVADVIDGLLRAATAPNIEGHDFDLGTGELTTTRAVLEQVAALVGESRPLPFGSLPDRPAERIRQANIAPARELLGWQPHTSLMDGLTQTIHWHQARLAQELAGTSP